MADPARARRVADRIHKTVAQVLERRIKDPRLGFVTITDVRVTGDLQQATVFYTVYGTEGERRRSASALKSATGLIRSEVGKALGIRLTPTISFQLDSLPTTARSIEDALAQAQAPPLPAPLRGPVTLGTLTPTALRMRTRTRTPPAATAPPALKAARALPAPKVPLALRRPCTSRTFLLTSRRAASTTARLLPCRHRPWLRLLRLTPRAALVTTSSDK